MKCVVTGAAGFIGSHLCERLLGDGHEVVAVDCFTDYYPRAIKEANAAELRADPRCAFLEEDVLEVDFGSLLDGVEVVFHQAAQAGVRASWGSEFDVYVRCNILATQRLLEAAKGSSLRKIVYASSSSVYGNVDQMPISEETLPRPVSPYGVTKLAAEELCYLYWSNYGVPTISLRYFTVYGPRQRPDMAMHKFIRAILNDEPLIVYGDGEQSRDFTFVSDVVEANIAAAEADAAGEALNIAGGSVTTVNEVIRALERILGKRARVEYESPAKGDVRQTQATPTRARELLGYEPRVSLDEGLRQEVEWYMASRHLLDNVAV
ncbi:MAG: NAD-dependent epimerase/dehydratase family protein [Armatimonadota bacterium]